MNKFDKLASEIIAAGDPFITKVDESGNETRVYKSYTTSELKKIFEKLPKEQKDM